MEQDQAPIVTVPRSEAEGSVGRQIREQWRILRMYAGPGHYLPLMPEYDATIRKLDALIGYEK